ncbi:MAG TPA: amidohydrolase family protein, partial [Bacteroidota bacterium]|nr:amidohydrolase family protein [Bacteroidota bacterium]
MNDQWRIFLSFIIVVSFFVVLFSRLFPGTADTLYVNGLIYTMDDENTVAAAMAVQGDKIVGIGNEQELADRFEVKAVVDLGGKAVFPGFIDAHAHFLSLGVARITVDLVGTRSEQEVAQKVRERVQQVGKGVWIRGRGWDQNDWTAKRFPGHTVLD